MLRVLSTSRRGILLFVLEKVIWDITLRGVVASWRRLSFHEVNLRNTSASRHCLVYALMTPTELNNGVVLKSAMRKSRVHKGRRTKVPATKFGPTLTTAERHRRDELIMAGMYSLEKLCHQNDCRASTDVQLGDVERRYPLNAHTKALLGIGPRIHEPIDDDIPTDEEKLCTCSDVESNSDEEVDPA
uniref:Uncharacterized protein n=1 Tax=Solanum tuberosum TaxID=4113 RepID=M1DXB9_SOLTU